MKTFLVFLILAATALAATAQATDVTLTWLAPTANSDGTTPALIGGYNVYAAPTDAQLTALPNTIAGGKTLSVGNVLTATLKNVVPGTYVYAVTTWYCPSGPTGTNCKESAQSAHVSTTVGLPVVTLAGPGVPGKVTVTVSVSATKP